MKKAYTAVLLGWGESSGVQKKSTISQEFRDEEVLSTISAIDIPEVLPSPLLVRRLPFR